MIVDPLGALAEELQDLTEAVDPAFAKTMEMPVHPGVGGPSAGSRCPKGSRKHPDTGKCWPRDQLKNLMRGHEPVAAMHREKHLHHAMQAQTLAQSNPAQAQKHAAKAANHLKQAQYHHGQYQAIHRELYPHKYKAKGPASAPSAMTADPHATTGKGVQALPQFHMGQSVKSMGGQAWGQSGGGTSGASTPSHSPQGYHPFGPSAPVPHPSQVSQPPASHPSPAQAPTGGSSSNSNPSFLHTLGRSALHGITHAAAQRGARSGSLGWNALAGMLQHLTGAQPAVPPHEPPVHQAPLPMAPPPAPPKKKKAAHPV